MCCWPAVCRIGKRGGNPIYGQADPGAGPKNRRIRPFAECETADFGAQPSPSKAYPKVDPRLPGIERHAVRGQNIAFRC
jgi:hypothetical protein